LQQSNNNLDVAIQGNGFFQLTMPDGTIGYTRDGAFQLDNAGRLVSSSGLLVSGGITVPANASNFTVAQNGTVTVTVPGNTAPQTIGTITTASFINPAGLEPKGQNIYAETAASGQPNAGTPNANGLGSLMQGFVETSNVNVVQELVSMIQTQRAYEMNSKAIQTSDQMLQKLGQL
jgi:flagellar basal-body rod protein FlgG